MTNNQYKYVVGTNKRVEIVSHIHGDEYVVREVFVDDEGNDCPGGPHFAAHVHDKPTKSWLEKELERIKKSFDAKRERLINTKKELDKYHKKAELRWKAIKDFVGADLVDQCEQLKTLEMFLTGKITHIFVEAYHPEILTFDDDKFFSKGYSQIESLKLVSLFGDSKGNMGYWLHRYSDGSGVGESTIHPASSYEGALAAAQKVFDAKCKEYLSSDKKFIPNLDDWKKIEGLVVPEEVMEKYRRVIQSDAQERIKKLNDEIAKLEQTIKEV